MTYAPEAVSALLRSHVVGLDTSVPLASGAPAPAINLDNAASTPALSAVLATLTQFLGWYSSVHRGTGYKSQVSTRAYEEARELVGRFVGARPGQHTTIFTKNTTEAINKLARRIPFRPGDIVLCSELEHHSNDLPWRQVARVIHVRCTPQGDLDEEHFAELLRRHRGRVRLVAITGGSNVTGAIPPIHRLAVYAHAAGAEIAVDCAQLAPHRPIDIGDLSDPAHLDYVTFSGHKLYAPFGSGALVGRADTFAKGAPESVGGGTVRTVTPDEIVWTDGPGRDEAGTPNVTGAVALAAAIKELQRIGMASIAAHEAALTSYALRRLAAIPGLTVYGDTDPERANRRLGVLAFSLEGVDHGLVAAALSYEHGIAVRSGFFCAQPYVRRLIGLDSDQGGCWGSPEEGLPRPGLVRASFGLYNTLADVDALADGLTAIAKGQIGAEYTFDQAHGAFEPEGQGTIEGFSLL